MLENLGTVYRQRGTCRGRGLVGELYELHTSTWLYFLFAFIFAFSRSFTSTRKSISSHIFSSFCYTSQWLLPFPPAFHRPLWDGKLPLHPAQCPTLISFIFQVAVSEKFLNFKLLRLFLIHSTTYCTTSYVAITSS